MSDRSPIRVLAIDPTSRGFGFVVLEGPDRLVDWGLVHARRQSPIRLLARLRNLLERLQPDVLILEDDAAADCRRGPRARNLLRDADRVARVHKVKVRRFSRTTVAAALAGAARANKHNLATQRPRLPPPRKPWVSEDERMGMFDAAGLALAYFERRRTHHPRGHGDQP